MAADERLQIILITPPAIDLEVFPDRLAAVLDAVEVACLRLSLASRDTDILGRTADACRLVAHARDVAVVIDNHLMLAERHGLDGVHLTDGARQVRKARKDLGADAIVGAFCGTSRHEGISAGEAGADYVAFGPIDGEGLGDGSLAPFELFDWCSEMIEVPVIAEGGVTESLVARFGPVTDLFAVGEEMWAATDAAQNLKRLVSCLG